ncbi:sigma-54 interaction domain-containing protein [Sinanaerobacter chloroacetimidivorans]|uniref:Sigma 54-interacting transcriptional regulator n=1 Tax=Sinanaerobacter chloroacetimidivorans TaxID=2818044 RepID=A0A8J8B4Z7_9FIRM|nr:sigma 54-interacting transcriptional regulator [Sinanaerobacter chloroacetimidivorans]MBR0599845.1 sigma 54-interacting transcriptional regulator [Sinanaerobacter chloroacetimidivorans]
MNSSEELTGRLQEDNLALKAQIAEMEEELEFLRAEKMTALVLGDAIADGICIVDSNGIVISINRCYTEITEITEEEIVGKSIREMLDNQYFSDAVSLEVLEKKQKISAMSTIYRNDRKVLLVGTPFFDANNNISKVITVMRNMTELIRLKEELETAELKKRQYKEELKSLKRERNENGFIGKDPSIARVKELIQYVAQTDATVLITGETGSGKEVVAREIFKQSKRKNGPYVKVNCSAIPENLLESELFGYVKGAFTGADRKDKKGLFETANNGTILLDEISEMPLKLQTKILRVLQERELTRVGGTESIKINTRVIASTNKNLEDMVKQNLFRADLYYRLNVFPIKLPSLRDRRDDIPDIAAAFLMKFNRIYDKSKSFSNEAITALLGYEWPGNVRELENIVERLVIISSNRILTKEDVERIIYMGEKKPSVINSINIGQLSLKQAVQEYEKEILERVLKECGNSYAAAEVLKTTQPTIVRKAQALGIPLRKK